MPECPRFGARLDEGTRQSIAHGQRIRACEFHRLRQSGIDEELFDVIAGFDAMTPQAVQRRVLTLCGAEQTGRAMLAIL